MSNKYDLLLVNTLTDKTIREQPWYKERIRTKLIKSMNPNSISKFMNTKDWTFVKDGLDDFRDGLPPPAHDGDIIWRPKGLAPMLTGEGSTESMNKIKETVNRNRFTKDDVCFSKETPLQKQRRGHINEIEYGLLQHPLALYPHLEKGVEPDLFEDIIDLLDPEMNMASDDEDDDADSMDDKFSEGFTRDASNLDATGLEDTSRQADQPIEIIIPPQAPVTGAPNLEESGSKEHLKNMYKWLPKKEEAAKKTKKKAQEVRPESPSQDKHIKDVTQDFCKWVAGLGGESNNIEESTIYSLFASGYETKPALSVPIHVVELTNVPPELRLSAAIPEQGEETIKTAPVAVQKKPEWSYSNGNYVPSWAKFEYGAWYLPAKSWKRRDAGEPLLDPKQIKEQDQTEMKTKSDTLDSELAAIHGSSAFMDFINRKNCRKPEFLARVSDIQKKQKEEEEKLRIEQEAKARSKARQMGQATPTKEPTNPANNNS